MPGRSETVAHLGLGGNIGDPAKAMAQALQRLDEGPGTRVRAVSSLYRTPPWGLTDQPDFLNAVAAIVTDLEPAALMARCLDIEQALKRVRRERWGPRAIDIDILTYGDATVREEGLQIPHPRLAERAFVLVPLAEIAPQLTIDGKAVEDRLKPLDSNGIVRLETNANWWSV